MKTCKLFSGILAIIMVVLSLSACRGSLTEAAKMIVQPGEDGKIAKDPLELTIHMRVWNGAYDYNKQTMFQEAFKDTNIKLIGTSSEAASNAQQEFNIMIASSPLPDLIHGDKKSINKNAIDGAMIPLDDLIKEYAPNILKFLEENPWARKGSIASDGKLYYVPFVREGVPSVGFYIRTDWLKKLDLDIPKTVDEYYKVLKAFKEDDPNGNGIKDEVPYFYRGQNTDGLLQLWNAMHSWYIDKNGKVVHGKTMPEFMMAMQNLAGWYAEGLIDKEIYSRGQQARNILLGDNVGGSTHDWFSSTGSFNESLKNKIQGFEFKAIAPPADMNGLVKEAIGRNPLPGTGWAISKDNKYVVETIKYMDYWYSERGIDLFNYGVKDVDYTIIDGKKVFTDKVLKAEGGPPTYMRDMGQNEQGSFARIAAEMQAMSKDAIEGFNLYNDNRYCTEQFPALSFTEEEERIIKEKEVAITTYMSELQQKWLFGVESLNQQTFQIYLEQIKALGYENLQKAYQAAYDRYIQE